MTTSTVLWRQRAIPALLVALTVGCDAAVLVAGDPDDLTDAAVAAMGRGDLEQASRYANTALARVPARRGKWYYGNVVHHANLVLGMAALRSGDLERARQGLLAAGKTPGSPQLNSFGPNMRLALELLQRGERAVVLEYLRLCASFWESDQKYGQLKRWARMIEAGKLPDFGANLVYGGWPELTTRGEQGGGPREL
jgi:hypothetical protein